MSKKKGSGGFFQIAGPDPSFMRRAINEASKMRGHIHMLNDRELMQFKGKMSMLLQEGGFSQSQINQFMRDEIDSPRKKGLAVSSSNQRRIEDQRRQNQSIIDRTNRTANQRAASRKLIPLRSQPATMSRGRSWSQGNAGDVAESRVKAGIAHPIGASISSKASRVSQKAENSKVSIRNGRINADPGYNPKSPIPYSERSISWYNLMRGPHSNHKIVNPSNSLISNILDDGVQYKIMDGQIERGRDYFRKDADRKAATHIGHHNKAVRLRAQKHNAPLDAISKAGRIVSTVSPAIAALYGIKAGYDLFDQTSDMLLNDPALKGVNSDGTAYYDTSSKWAKHPAFTRSSNRLVKHTQDADGNLVFRGFNFLDGTNSLVSNDLNDYDLITLPDGRKAVRIGRTSSINGSGPGNTSLLSQGGGVKGAYASGIINGTPVAVVPDDFRFSERDWNRLDPSLRKVWSGYAPSAGSSGSDSKNSQPSAPDSPSAGRGNGGGSWGGGISGGGGATGRWRGPEPTPVSPDQTPVLSPLPTPGMTPAPSPSPVMPIAPPSRSIEEILGDRLAPIRRPDLPMPAPRPVYPIAQPGQSIEDIFAEDLMPNPIAADPRFSGSSSSIPLPRLPQGRLDILPHNLFEQYMQTIGYGPHLKSSTPYIAPANALDLLNFRVR